jgi:ATP-dependent DNA helicase RecQ
MDFRRRRVPTADISNELRRVLKTVFGYDNFRPKQEDIIHRLLGGGDALVVMPTGGGKSLCYQLPALVQPGVAVVVSPLISLMQDQIDALLQLGVRAAALNSSMSRPQQRAVERRLEAGDLDLLYVAPERLMTPAFLEQMACMQLGLIAIDEAHCISQWGHDFRPEYLQLATIRERFPGVPCIAVTATADEPTQHDILERLNMLPDDLVVTGFDRPNIRFAVALKRNTKEQLSRFLKREHADDAGIIYCLSRRKVEEIAAWLNENGRRAVPYHAGLSAAEREENQQRFLREEGLIVVATVAFGMGIDKPNVRFVVHVNVPKNLEGYYQEIGRAGRDGLPADAWMLYGMSDTVMLRRFIEDSDAEDRHKWALHHKLNAIVGYCETPECRRRVLLNYFGDKAEAGDEGCGNCDNCLNPVRTWDGTVAAQKALSCVYRTGQRFGAGHVIDVLVGKRTEKVQRSGHDRVSTFGIGSDRSATEWRSIIRQLTSADLLRVDVMGYGGLKLTEASSAVLKGKRAVRMREDPAPQKAVKKKARRAAGGSRNDLPATAEEQVLFDRLRDLRLQLARTQEVPPYVIFHDSTLAAMARSRPTNLASFANLPGVGAVKLERYGEVFIDAIRSHATKPPD